MPLTERTAFGAETDIKLSMRSPDRASTVVPPEGLLGDQLYRRFDHAVGAAVDLLALDDFQRSLDTEHGLPGGKLVSGRQDAAVFQHWLDGVDVVVTDHLHLAGLACRTHSGNGTDGHAVVAGQQGFDVRVFAEDRGGNLVALVDLPVTGLQRDDLDLRRFHRVLEACGASLGVGGGGHTFNDADFVTGLQLLGQILADQTSAFAVIRAYERDGDVLAFDHGRVELVIYVDHGDTGIDGFLDHGNHGLGVSRRDDQRIDLGQNHLLDDARLARSIRFVLDAVGDQLEIAGMVFLISLGTVFHGQEELVGQGLHDQCDFGFFRSLGESRRDRQRGGCGGQHSDSKKTSSEWQLHGFTP